MHKPGAEAGTIRNHDVSLGTQWRLIAGVEAPQVGGNRLRIGLDLEHERQVLVGTGVHVTLEACLARSRDAIGCACVGLVCPKPPFMLGP